MLHYRVWTWLWVCTQPAPWSLGCCGMCSGDVSHWTNLRCRRPDSALVTVDSSCFRTSRATGRHSPSQLLEEPSGLSLAHGPAHLYRATIEGIAMATRHGLDAIIAAGVSVDEIRACGGATRSAVTMQIYADVLGQTVITTGIADASAMGAAITGAIGAGLAHDYASAAAAMGRPGAVFEPDAERHSAYTERYDLFRRTYPALLPLMREMAEPNKRESRP